MKGLIKKLLRESLLDEAIKTGHLEDESYLERISNEINWLNIQKHKKYPELKGKPFNDMPDKFRPEIDKKLDFIESLEFKVNDIKDIGIWTFISPVDIKHWPYRAIDKGNKLIVIIGDNKLKTLFWKHEFKTFADNYTITFEELEEFVNSNYYNGVKKPINVHNLKAWKKNKNGVVEPTVNLNKFKKITLLNGTKIKYFFNANKFKTLDDKDLKADDIFDSLPEDIQDKVINLLENKKK